MHAQARLQSKLVTNKTGVAIKSNGMHAQAWLQSKLVTIKIGVAIKIDMHARTSMVTYNQNRLQSK